MPAFRATALVVAIGAIPAVAEAARFAVYGDTRDNPADHAKVVAGVVAAKPDFALFTGDVALHGNSTEEWDRFAQIERPLSEAGIRVYAVRGNHDTGPLFAKHFGLPLPATTGTAEYYSFDALGVHLLGMDTEGDAAPGSPQYLFVKADLEAHVGTGPVVVFLHRALYSSGYHGSSAQLLATYGPLFERNHVLAVFQGHDHDYERSKPIDGVTYLVEGGGGADQRPFEGAPPPWSSFRLATFGFATVDVLPASLEIRAYDENSSVIDQVTLPRVPAAAGDAGAQPVDLPPPRPAESPPVEGSAPPAAPPATPSSLLVVGGGALLLAFIGGAWALQRRGSRKE